jgi:DNA-binding CsgD family transcriptional regulator
MNDEIETLLRLVAAGESARQTMRLLGLTESEIEEVVERVRQEAA